MEPAGVPQGFQHRCSEDRFAASVVGFGGHGGGGGAGVRTACRHRCERRPVAATARTEDSGAAYVFLRSDTTWSQQAYLKAFEYISGYSLQPDEQFGGSVAVSGDNVVVGDADEGKVYTFLRSGTTWSQQAELEAVGPHWAYDHFGGSVVAWGDLIVVGARLDNSSATGVDGDPTAGGSLGSGAAYVFDLNLSPWTDVGFALPGALGSPRLEGSGTLIPGTPGALELTSAAPTAPALLLIATAMRFTPFLGGTLIPAPFSNSLPLVTDPTGKIALPWASWPSLPTGSRVYFQFVIEDAGAIQGAALSNALEAEMP